MEKTYTETQVKELLRHQRFICADTAIQSSESDAHLYHESILNAPSPSLHVSQQKEGPWKLVGHSHQIADTGDYDGCYEITDGKVSIYTKEDNDEALHPIVNALNESGAKFYLDDAAEFELHLEKMETERLRKELASLPVSQQEEVTWDRLFEKCAQAINLDLDTVRYAFIPALRWLKSNCKNPALSSSPSVKEESSSQPETVQGEGGKQKKYTKAEDELPPHYTQVYLIQNKRPDFEMMGRYDFHRKGFVVGSNTFPAEDISWRFPNADDNQTPQ